jgi:kynurenine formamidase
LAKLEIPQTEPTEDEVLGYIDQFSNWGRWGDDDVHGALNHITAEKTAQAAALVHDGDIVSCSRILEWAPKPARHEAAVQPVHFMMATGESVGDQGGGSAHDWMGVPLHGLYITHMDGQSHMFWNGKMHNGMDAGRVTVERGAQAGGIDDVSSRGIVTRGVLIDVPRVRGSEPLRGSAGVTLEDLENAERDAGITVEPGDFVLVRTGYGAHRSAEGGAGGGGAGSKPSVGMPGLLPSTLPWIYDRGVSVLATDTGTDAFPSAYSFVPVHTVSMVAMGIFIIDACDLETLATVCEQKGRWHFMISCSPLRLKNATGSPVNPLAVF